MLAVLIIGIGFLVLPTNQTAAVQSVPYQMNFQGRLNNASGAPMASGTYNMKFTIYSAATGGTALWTETHAVSASTAVTVTSGGLFSVQLGSVTGLPPTIFNSSVPLYLAVELPTPATATSSSPSWTEGAMSPRNPIESSPYAINSDLLDGLDSSAFAVASGSANYIQNTTSPQAASFNVTGSGAVSGTFTATGASVFKDSTNSATAFQVQNSSGLALLTVDTTDGITAVQAASIYQDPLIVAASNPTGQSGLIGLQGSDGTHFAIISADANQNIAFGLGAGNIGTASGGQNIAFGSYALYSNTTGGANIAIGGNALAANSTGTSNIAIGHQSQTNATGHDNTTVGDGSGYSITSGVSNTAFGSTSLDNTTTGSQNVAIGQYAGYLNTTGSNNTFLGTGAGNCHYTAQFCTSPNLQGSTAVGYEAQVQASYSMVLGSVDDPVNVGIGTTVPLNTFSVAPVAYTTGTASQSGTTVTGSGTTWTAAMVGDELVFNNGDHGVVTGFTNATHLTLNTSQTEASQAYRLHYAGLNVTNTGNIGIGTTTPGSNALSVVGTAQLQASSATAFQVQNTAGSNYLSVNTTSATGQVLTVNGATNAGALYINQRYDQAGGSPNGGGIYFINATGTAYVRGIYYNHNSNHVVMSAPTDVSGNLAVTGNSGSGIISAKSAGGVNVFTVNDYSGGAAAKLATTASSQLGMTIQGFASQSVDLLQLQNSSSATLSKFNANGDLIVGGTGSAASSNALLIQNTSAAALFTVNTSTNSIVLGSGSNSVTFTAAGGLVAAGTARHTKTILLPAEYTGAVLDAASDATCTSANNGTMTSGYDSTNRMNFYNWTSSQATAQCYNVVVQIPIPSDFDGWTGAPSISMKKDSNGTGAYAVKVVDSTGTTDSNYNYTTPGTLGTTWSNITTSAFGNTAGTNGTTSYVPGGYFTIKVRVSSTSGANVSLGNISLTYNSKF